MMKMVSFEIIQDMIAACNRFVNMGHYELCCGNYSYALIWKDIARGLLVDIEFAMDDHL